MSLAVQVSGVSKKFKLSQERRDSIKERAVRFGRSARGPVDFWALRDIDFEVPTGNTVALLGHNGSGKSTLLKCIGGILRPTTGEIRTRGRVASLLELGAGFHPDLTGRENVFLNASILGLSRRDIEARFDDIVGFAELEKFIDNQVKHYSSGMYVRLGFAVAIHSEPDVLLIDEVLAVGDELFQQKCLQRISDLQDADKTIIVVSHNADLMRRISDLVVVLDHGHQITVDEPTEAIRTFRRYLHGSLHDDGAGDQEVTPDADEGHTRRVRIADVAISGGSADHQFRHGDRLHVRFRAEVDAPVDDVIAAIHIIDTENVLVYGVNSEILTGEPWTIDRTTDVEFRFDQLPLLDGHYRISIGLHNKAITEHYDQAEFVSKFEFVGTRDVAGIADLRGSVTRT